MSTNSSTGLKNNFRPYISTNFRVESDSNSTKNFFNKSLMQEWYSIAALTAMAVLVLCVICVVAINWFLKERKFRKLRHRLIPIYTFDPNEEDDWNDEFLDSNQPIKTKDYQSIEKQENLAPIR